RPRRRPQWADRGGGSGGAGTASSRTSRLPDAPPDAPLPLGGTSPDAVVLSGVQRPAQALTGHGAAPANRLRLLDLCQGRPVGPGREEQLRIFVAAGGPVAPVVAGRCLRRVEQVRHARAHHATASRSSWADSRSAAAAASR